MSKIVLQCSENITKKITDKLNKRFKVTSFDVCSSFLVLGSNSGTIYFLSCENFDVIQSIPTENGPILEVCISPDQLHLAYSASSGIVYITEFSKSASKQYKYASSLHKGIEITCLAWSVDGENIYIGDATGHLSLLRVPSTWATLFMRNMTESILLCDSQIIQLDEYHQFILVSTTRKTYLCNTKLETFASIASDHSVAGSSSCFFETNVHSFSRNSSQYDSLSFDLKDGVSGSFMDVISARDNKYTQDVDFMENFLNEKDRNEFGLKSPVIIGVTPSNDIWVSDFNGKTQMNINRIRCNLNTRVDVVEFNDLQTDSINEQVKNKSSFKFVSLFLDNFILIATSSIIYLIDVDNMRLLFWCDLGEDIKEIRSCDSDIFVFTSQTRLHRFTVATLQSSLMCLYDSGLNDSCVKLFLKHSDELKRPNLSKFWLDFLNKLNDRVNNSSILDFLENNFNSETEELTRMEYKISDKPVIQMLDTELDSEQNKIDVEFKKSIDLHESEISFSLILKSSEYVSKEFIESTLKASRSLQLNGLKHKDTNILSQWLQKYITTNDEFSVDVVHLLHHNLTSDGPYLTPLLTLLKETSSLLIKCMQSNLTFNSFDRKIDTSISFLHPLSSVNSFEKDVFYADLINNDKCLMDYSLLLDKFESVDHLMYNTWFALKSKLSSVKIISDIEFKRSTQIFYLDDRLRNSGIYNFIISATNCSLWSTLFDVYYFLLDFQQSSASSLPVDFISRHILQYLSLLSSKQNISDIYLKYWSRSPEMQFEILKALTGNSDKGSQYSKSYFINPFLNVISLFPLYNPHILESLAPLWNEGFIRFILRYKIKPVQEIVRTVIEERDFSIVGHLCDFVHPAEHNTLISAFLRASYDNDLNKGIWESRKSNQFYSDGRQSKVLTDSDLVTLFLSNIHRRLDTLTMLHLLQKGFQAVLPSPLCLRRFFIESIMCSIAELKGKSLRWSMAQYFCHVPRLQFSVQIQYELDEIIKTEDSYCSNHDQSPSDSSLFSDTQNETEDKCSELPSSETEVLSKERPLHSNIISHLPDSTYKSYQTKVRHHWGVKMKLIDGICQLCHLDLTLEPMLVPLGLIVYQCGHGYHKVCSRQYHSGCLQCLNLKSNHSSFKAYWTRSLSTVV